MESAAFRKTTSVLKNNELILRLKTNRYALLQIGYQLAIKFVVSEQIDVGSIEVRITKRDRKTKRYNTNT